jgi:outer membrane autotransporter protein
MNKIYTTVWCDSRQQWVVTSELASGSGRPKLAPKKSALALLLGAMLLPAAPVKAVDHVDVTLDEGSEQTIGSGDTATNTTINSGAQQRVNYVGWATSTNINDGWQLVFEGGTATDTTINNGGRQDVVGGSASETTINSGVQSVNGGTATNTTINSGGKQYVTSGGLATDTIINSGGWQTVSGGGIASGTVINSSGGQFVTGGGTATDTTIINKGRQTVAEGGIASGTVMNSSGEQFVSGGGTATDTTINEGLQIVFEGGTATDTTINSGGLQSVEGGTATDTTINNGGRQYVDRGSASETTINSGGQQHISTGGTATDTIIGGLQYVEGTAASNTISNGGYQYVTSGGLATDTTISYGGGQNITSGGGTATRTTINFGGQQDISNTGLASATMISGGIQNINNGGVALDTIIDDGGGQHVGNGGKVMDTEIRSGAQVVSGGGSATETLINGGVQHVRSGGSTTSTTIKGGSQYVSGGGITIDTTIEGGQSWLETGALADGKTWVNAGGELQMEAGSLARDVLITGGTLSVSDLTDATTGHTPAQVDKLTMSGGNVSFLHDSKGDYAALNISELSGTGNFLFNTSLAERNANFVTIEQGTGNFGIAVTDSGKEITDHDDLTVNLIHDQGGDIDFEMVTVSGQSTRAIDGGTYMYTLHSGQNKDGLNGGNVWYLGQMTDEPGGGGENPGGGGENPGGGKPITTPATDAILSMSNSGLNVIHTELDGLRTYRAGLDKTGPESNVWGHYLGSKNNIDTSNGAAYQLNQNGMEIGADIRTDFARGSLITGALMSYSDNKVKHARGGKSSIDSYGLGLYGTWFDASGFYADGVIKGNRLNNKLSAVMTNGGKTSGDWKQYALSTAVEGGYQFDIRDDVSLTPYARLAFVQMTSESVKLSNGMKGGIDKPRSVTGEVGAKLAGKFSAGSTEFKPYLSAAVVQELADSNEVTINGRNRFDNNVKETSGKYGLGASVNVGKDVTLYGEANYRQGSHTETPVQGVAGIRFGF